MSDDAEDTRRYVDPNTGSHPIPTVKQYKELEKSREAANHPINSHDGASSLSPANAATTSSGTSPSDKAGAADSARDAQNKNIKIDTTQTASSSSQDPKQRRKDQKKKSADRVGREVTDPVTHLPVTIHDFTDEDLKKAQDEQIPGGDSDTAKSPVDGTTSTQNYDEATLREQQVHAGMENLFPPPEFDLAREELARVYKTALSIGLGFNIVIASLLFLLSGTASDRFLSRSSTLTKGMTLGTLWTSGLAISAGSIWALQDWAQRKVRKIWDEGTWEAEKKYGGKQAKADEKRYQSMLNTLLGSIWPVMNPDLFNSLADMIEDIMQASLPTMVRMVSIEDIGQGSEPIRILAIRPLSKGAAAKSVSSDGKLERGGDRSEGGSKGQANTVSGDSRDPEDAAADAGTAASGMEAEEGEFINLEVALAYSAVRSHKTKDRSKNAHIYMAFYLPGNIKLPVWVELRGMIGIMRARLQLTPDPPFVALCTATFMGQPKIDLSCVPLVKKGLNIMDMPLISNFVQSAINAATAEYVAPKSITLDLKSMLAGEDFKKDTTGKGIMIVKVKRAFGFKAGDTAIPLVKEGSSDPYVSISWAKFGKPLWTTRVFQQEMDPYFNETAYLLVGPEELNAEESLRLQLWDSDRTTADDDLGRIEVELKELMNHSESGKRMWDRKDDFEALEDKEAMPGSLEWSVGYFPKTQLMDWQVERAKSDSVKGDPNIKTVAQLKEKVYAESKRKLRESAKDETAEVEQQAKEDFEAAQIDLFASAPPSEDYPSGILSVQIHQVVGLKIADLNQNRNEEGGEQTGVEGDHEALPSSYCTIILNNEKVYKTRTKPKNAEPFFNAVCERFIRDWRTAELLVSVRNQTVHEDDSIMGAVHLSIAKTFANRSQTSQVYPLAGGIGYGRIRISLVFRPILIQLPPKELGWDVGTIEVAPEVTVSDSTPQELKSQKLKFRTAIGRGKMYSQGDEGPTTAAKWSPKHPDTPLLLPVTRRYANNLVVEFHTKSSHFLHIGSSDKTSAYGVLWLEEIRDDADESITVPIYRGDVARAEKNYLPISEMGEHVGDLHLKLKFWPGLGSYHTAAARSDRNMSDVMEVLQCAGGDEEDGPPHISAAHDDGSSSSDSDSDGDGKAPKGLKGVSATDGKAGGSGGIAGDLKSYARRKDALHRQNRGAMQWKGPRTLRWMKHKAEHLADKVTGGLDDRQPGVETEA